MKLCGVLAGIAFTFAGVSFSAQGQAGKLLTPPEVVLVTKVSGVQTVTKNSITGASGDLNFADAAAELLLMMTLKPAAEFAVLKRIAADAVTGVGDEAFAAPNESLAAGTTPYMLVFRKGAHAVTLTSFFDRNGGQRVSQAQLKKLAQLVASKL